MILSISDDLMAKLAASLRGCPACTASAGVPCDGQKSFDFIHQDRHVSNAKDTP